MPGQLGVGERYSHSVQLCVPFRMALGVDVEDEDTDADVGILGKPRTMTETFGWIAHRVTVRGRGDAGRGRVAGLPRMGEFVRGRNGRATQRIGPNVLHLESPIS